MGKRLDAAAIRRLKEAARQRMVGEILTDLAEALDDGPIDGERDTWVGGFQAAIDTIRCKP